MNIVQAFYALLDGKKIRPDTWNKYGKLADHCYLIFENNRIRDEKGEDYTTEMINECQDKEFVIHEEPVKEKIESLEKEIERLQARYIDSVDIKIQMADKIDALCKEKNELKLENLKLKDKQGKIFYAYDMATKDAVCDIWMNKTAYDELNDRVAKLQEDNSEISRKIKKYKKWEKDYIDRMYDLQIKHEKLEKEHEILIQRAGFANLWRWKIK